jgi:hypothetical protein
MRPHGPRWRTSTEMFGVRRFRLLFGEAEESGYVSRTCVTDSHRSIALVCLTEEGAAAYEDYER